MIRRNFNNLFTSASIKHIAYDWSASEQGNKHPSKPVGYTIRDQGQFDIFAGSSRFILQDNNCFLRSNNLGILSDKIVIKIADIQSLLLNGRYINRDIYQKDKLPIFKKTNIEFVGPATYVQNNDGSIGKLINTIGFNEVIDLKELFIEQKVKTKQKNLKVN